jgi:protocatechuate 3,4-dioxygenase beta subunit
MYVYHTDYEGYYSKNGNEEGVQKWHGKLHGWCRTSQNGNYRIETIRPAPYPSLTMPAHIHPVIKLPNDKLFYINDFVFEDDSLVNDAYLKSLSYSGGNGVVILTKDEKGTWIGKRNIILAD